MSHAGRLLDVIDHPDTDNPAIPAATVLLVRDAPSSTGLEVFMIQRGHGTSFGGAWAFPGGVIEVDDVEPDAGRDPLPAARRAAARETTEEVGLIVDPTAMAWWSHWVPPANTPAPKRFSTWFLLAPAAVGHEDHHVAIDGHEVHAHRWVRPSIAVEEYLAGEIDLVAPTVVTLVDLARRSSVEHAQSSIDVERYATRLVAAGGHRWCVWHGDAAYDTGDLDAAGPRNRLMIGEAIRRPYERTGWT